MLTIFSIPKAFAGRTGVQQRNAIESWNRVHPGCEVLLFGNDPGVGDAAATLGVRHIPDIQANEHGTPLLSAAFETAQVVARHDLLVYVNADIMLLPELASALGTITFSQFLACGRRRDLDLDEALDFSCPAWTDALRALAATRGRPHGISGLDYFVFRRGSVRMPPFAVGRPGWDNWLIFDMRRRGVPVIDASAAIEAIHQNHDFSHSKFGEKARVGGPEFAGNIELAGGLHNMLTLRDADWTLGPAGPERVRFPRAAWVAVSLWWPWRMALAALRKWRA